jgi:protease PrsW
VLFIIGAIPAAVLAGVTNAGLATTFGLTLTMVLLAPIAEEVIKYVGMRLPVRRAHVFDEPIDGMIYGSTVGLGFAFTENIDYLISGLLGVPIVGDVVFCEPGFSCFLELAFVRGTGTALVHALCTGISGYYLAKRVIARRSRRVEVKGIAWASGLHAAWNMGLHFPAIAGASALFAILSRRALAASPHRLAELDDSHHWIEHFAVGDGLLQPCPECQHLHHPGQRYCSICGFRLMEARMPHSRPCPACDQPQPVTANFCAACGTGLEPLQPATPDTEAGP